MKIASADVAMTSQYSFTEATVSLESFKLRVDKGNTDVNQISFSKLEIDTFEISDQAKSLQMSLSQNGSVGKLNYQEDSIAQLSESDKRKIELIENIIKRLTGKKIKLFIPEKNEINNPNINLNIKHLINIADIHRLQQPQSVGWRFVFNKSITHTESESTSFSAQAAIKTEDGRDINVDLQLNLSREFITKNEINMNTDILKVDPLVVNYSASSASVTQEKYQFDIDANGTLDQISFAGPGSGFLSLDLNNDGIINDGKELFGPNSGNGFSDLANYDTDKNGWIDENDSIYEKLRIWTKDAEGNDQLFALGEKGIGAIYLGNVNTSFALKDTNNQMDAQVQKTGIFLREDGTAGTVQHVDLAI
ncbi:hypothetical protein [Desulfosporosinus sp. OT]|uniref:hypothetical protein n=1 Tax=Desulfosporosinus sp. OT TaxID=913865 RepID=UPI000223A833|nr:hypothetical protein [Desulfosporosinus sp. OT]EGW41916.1 hypothetical protein DOT_0126 [Desulfosporosinus sp. OT]